MCIYMYKASLSLSLGLALALVTLHAFRRFDMLEFHGDSTVTSPR